jgi:hypothetical protein
MHGHEYTAEEILYLAEITPGRSYKDIAEMFNTRFGLSLSLGAIKGTLARCTLTNGRDGCFPPGHPPANKGVKGVHYPGMEATQFKPGNRPHTWRPVGSERVDKDGYTWVKVTEPKVRRMKHVLVWEAAHGPVPRGHVVIFGDSDRQNFDLDNLLLVSRAQLALLNKDALIGGSAELTRTGIALVEMRRKIAERRKG